MPNVNVRIMRALKKKLDEHARHQGVTMGEVLDGMLVRWLDKHEKIPLEKCPDFDKKRAERRKLRKEEDLEQLGVGVEPATKDRLKAEVRRRYWADDGLKRKFPCKELDVVEEAIRESP